MRTMIAAGMLAFASLGVSLAASLQETPAPARPATARPPAAQPMAPKPAATKPAATKPAATKPAPAHPAPAKPAGTNPAPAAGTTPASMEAPKLPPFAGEIVNFDRRGARVVACVDASKVAVPPRPGPDGKPVAAPPPAPAGPPRLRIWVIEREVMQELMTTGGLCDPSWSPDGQTFAAAGARGVFTFTQPNFDPRVIVAGQLQAPPPGAPAPREYDDPVWSPNGARLAFRSSAGGASRVEVVDIKSAEVVVKRDGPVKALRWVDDKTLLVDADRVPVP
jgi:hypothetical protein